MVHFELIEDVLKMRSRGIPVFRMRACRIQESERRKALVWEGQEWKKEGEHF